MASKIVHIGSETNNLEEQPRPEGRPKRKKQVTMRLSGEVIDYFKGLSEETRIPYQSLINLYLMDCVENERKPNFEWKNGS